MVCTSGTRLGRLLVIAALLLCAEARHAEGQAPPPDTVVQQPDSARLAIMRRLERLARPPGVDSILFTQDSARLADAQAGVRPGGGPDSVTTALFGMPGYSLTEYDSESADFAAQDRILVLQAPPDGRARVSQEGSVIEADSSITFNEATGSIRTVGQATFTPPEGDPVDAVNMVYDLGQGRGSARGARTSWDQDGATWVVEGDMPYAAQDSTFMSHASFTSCDLEEPHYHFQTDEIKIVGGNVLVARGVRLYFADVPVAWLPFMAQSLSRGRSSGLLTPRFSVNDIVRTSGGYRRRVSNMGFYWAMSDYSDALVAMDWFSESFFSLTTSMRYRFSRQFLNGALSVRRFWRTDGSREFALDTSHDWQVDERTQLRASGRFVNNTDFVRQYSYNPQEVTQSIDSEAGLSRRFDWGNLSLSANRQQYMSDDRTAWTLPGANLSLSPITLFRAPSSEASFYNNMTWSGSGGVRRQTVDYLQPDTFAFSQANTVTSTANASSNLSIGRLTLSQGANVNESRTLDVPEAYLVDGVGADPAQLVTGVPARDIARTTLGWRAELNYQQQLIGSTTITPSLGIQGDMLRSDTDSLAQNWVSAPSRLNFGARLKTDVYGFYGGVGPFEAIRHKISPSFDYRWSPAATPDDIQRQVFGRQASQPANTLEISLTQTFEAKRRPEEQDEPIATRVTPVDSVGLESAVALGDSLAADEDSLTADQDAGPRRVETTPSVMLLAWRTSVVRYDFVEADSVGLFLGGFGTTRLNNQFSSDYLRGLSVSLDHELFADELGEGGALVGRRLAPHLSQVNLSFALGSRSSIFRWLGFGGGDGEEAPEEPEDTGATDFEGRTDESTVVPISGREEEVQQPRRSGSAGGWTANINYSLLRPRDPELPARQALSGTVRLEPTENWSVSWRTSYDLEASAFNDHSIRLSRDLHRWQANFDFLQTATGNWTFRFEVSLLDNRDLKFDYNQRNLDLGLPESQR